MVPLFPSPLEGLRAGCAAIHRSGGAREGEEGGAKRRIRGGGRLPQRRVRGEASHSRLVRSINLSTGDLPLWVAPSTQGLLTSNRTTGPICPAGQLEAPHPDLPLNASGRPSPTRGEGAQEPKPQGGVSLSSSSSGGPPLERSTVVMGGVWRRTGIASNEGFLLGGVLLLLPYQRVQLNFSSIAREVAGPRLASPFGPHILPRQSFPAISLAGKSRGEYGRLCASRN